MTAWIYYGKSTAQNRIFLDQIELSYDEESQTCVVFDQKLAPSSATKEVEFNLVPETEYFELDEKATQDEEKEDQQIQQFIAENLVSSAGVIRYGKGSLYYGAPIYYLAEDETGVQLYRLVLQYDGFVLRSEMVIGFNKNADKTPDPDQEYYWGAWGIPQYATVSYDQVWENYNNYVRTDPSHVSAGMFANIWSGDVWVSVLKHFMKQ